jgi:hypothetical protein
MAATERLRSKDLFDLSDEQILEIDPEPQDVEIPAAHPDAKWSSPASAPWNKPAKAA